jgi:large subunit ribosomal protein L3
MLTAILGRKVGMTQIFSANGAIIPVTVIEAGPCTITQVKTVGTDGYEGVQLGFGSITLKHATRPVLGHLGHSLPLTDHQRRKQQQEQAKVRQEARQKKAAAAESADEAGASETEADEAETATQSGATKSARRRRGTGKALGPFKVLREVRILDGEVPAVGDEVTVEMFTPGEEVDVIGTSKGKGFAGVMKRHGFGGGPRTHGQSDRPRAPGSIGPGTTPGRVLKGTRMAGRMGNERVTIKALRVVESDPERNLLLVQGSVPGANGGILMIRKGEAQIATAARQRA